MRRLVAVLADRHAEALARIEDAISRETSTSRRPADDDRRAEWLEAIDGCLRLSEALVTAERGRARWRRLTTAVLVGLLGLGLSLGLEAEGRIHVTLGDERSVPAPATKTCDRGGETAGDDPTWPGASGRPYRRRPC